MLFLNWPAIALAIILSYILGALWFGPLFGKQWAECMGIKFGPENKPAAKAMKRAFFLQFVGTIFTVYVLAYTINVWRPTVWGVGTDASNFQYAFCAAVFTWIGFYVPTQLGRVSWENRPWKLFFINSAHNFVNLLIISLVLSYWK
ncbi:MAG: DUF1761 domain-containing protein [Oligoflexia bacterium]|nr:DUF1761 domain-containing protein [Oligoflexia bacterium]